MSHVLLLPFGTSGSVFPFIWLGRLLMSRGHRVTMITAPMHKEPAVSAGLNFVALGNDVVEQMLQDPDLWRPGRGSKVAYQYAGRATQYYAEAIEGGCKLCSVKGFSLALHAPLGAAQ